MKKVLFTESQMREILLKEGINNWDDISHGYLNTNSAGSEAPDNVHGSKVSVDTDNPDNEEKTSVTTTDKIANSIQRRTPYGFGSRAVQQVYENIEDEKFRANKFQKQKAIQGGTKMGQNIKNEKEVSNATQRQRKHRMENYKQQMPREEYKQKYGNIEKTVKSSLGQMSNRNKINNNITDTSKLTNANDASKINNNI